MGGAPAFLERSPASSLLNDAFLGASDRSFAAIDASHTSHDARFGATDGTQGTAHSSRRRARSPSDRARSPIGLVWSAMRVDRSAQHSVRCAIGAFTSRVREFASCARTCRIANNLLHDRRIARHHSSIGRSNRLYRQPLRSETQVPCLDTKLVSRSNRSTSLRRICSEVLPFSRP
jgi:hypothetical protein